MQVDDHVLVTLPEEVLHAVFEFFRGPACHEGFLGGQDQSGTRRR